MSENTPHAPQGEFILFQAADGLSRVECRFESDMLWLTQAAMADLYQITPQAVTQHIKAVYDEEELEQNSTCKSYLQVAMEGVRQVSRKLRMADLFGRDKSIISKHLKSIYEDAGLLREATVAKYATIQLDSEHGTVTDNRRGIM